MSSRFVSQTQLTTSHYHLSTNEIAFRCMPGRRAHEHGRWNGSLSRRTRYAVVKLNERTGLSVATLLPLQIYTLYRGE